MLVHDPPRLDHETGEVLEHDNEDVQRLTNTVRYLETELDAAQDEITKLLVENKSLKTRNANADVRAARRQEIHEAFQAWQEICGKRRCKLKEPGKRFKSINAALVAGYTVEQIRVACLGAMHNNPWGDGGKRGRMDEIETFCREEPWLEEFHDAGCDWLAENGHDAPPKFSGPGSNLAKVAAEFQKANQAFVPHPDGRHATAMCPVCVRELTVMDGSPKASVVCPSGCDVELIKAALRVKQGQRREGHDDRPHRRGDAVARAEEAVRGRDDRGERRSPRDPPHPHPGRVRAARTSPDPPIPADPWERMRQRVRDALHPVRRPPLERQRRHAPS